MSIAQTDRSYTPEDLLTMPDGEKYELVDGHLLERNVGSFASYVALQLGGLLATFVKTHRLGNAFDSDATYQCFPNNRIRKPDISFVQAGRLPPNQIPTGHMQIAPDLAVEVVSPSDLYYEVESKIEEYFRVGVRLIWVINPDIRLVSVYRLDGTTVRLKESAELEGEDVVPGFRCAIAELFASI